jgi:hypothetical protein
VESRSLSSPRHPSRRCRNTEVILGCGAGALMKIIDYAKYSKKYSPRSAVLMALFDSIFTGFFLSAALFESLRRHDAGLGCCR